MEKIHLYTIIFLYLCLLQAACAPKTSIDEVMDTAGKNRAELQKVLRYYENDSLKLEAAKFLIANMKGAYATDSIVHAAYAPFYEIYNEVMEKYDYRIDKQCGEEIDSLWQVFLFAYSEKLTDKRNEDAASLKASTLITEIELAFKAWQGNVYTRNASFEEFCEYILPYRRANGLTIDSARERFYRQHHKNFYTGKQGNDFIRETDSLLFLYKDITHTPYYVPQIPISDAATLERVKTGSCEQRCWFNSLLLSSLGMAAAIDFVPVWGNRNGGHSWNVIIVDGKSYAFESFWDNDRWKYKRIYNNRSCDSMWGKFQLAKVYRRTFSRHIEGPASDCRMAREDIPPLFLDERKKDVSTEYFDAREVTVTLNNDSLPADKQLYAYLSVYDYGQWSPIQWGKVKKGKATFYNMGTGVVYLPTYYINGKNIPAGTPFLLKADGTQQPLTAGKETETVKVRNYAGQVPFNENRSRLTSLVGGEFWGMRNGEKEELLFTINDTLQIEHRIFKPISKNSYRYIRLCLPSPNVTLGEVSFYSNEKAIADVCITTPLSANTTTETRELLTDGLSDTAFNGTAPQKFIEFDLNGSYNLSGIGISPYIRSWLNKLYHYELAYWDNGWQPIARQQGNADYLTFDHVPRHALLRLSNCEKGNKEHHRIFVYQEGKVVWY